MYDTVPGIMTDRDETDVAGRTRFAERARAFDYLFDAVVVTDMKGTITDWNAGAAKLYGYQAAEVLGQPVSILHAPEDVDRVTAQVFASIERQGHWTGEIRMRRKDHSIGWIESFVIPLLDDAGVPIGALGINRDITRAEERGAGAARLGGRLAGAARGLTRRRLWFPTGGGRSSLSTLRPRGSSASRATSSSAGRSRFCFLSGSATSIRPTAPLRDCTLGHGRWRSERICSVATRTATRFP